MNQIKKDRARIGRIYSQRCSGIVIPIMEVPAIFKVGMDALEGGADDQAIGDALLAAVEKVRCDEQL